MRNAEFIIKFISEAAQKGLQAGEAAKAEIQEIDLKLHEAEILKLRRMKLVSVLDHFGDETYRRRRVTSVPPSEDLEHSFGDLQQKIKDTITIKGPMNVRDLIMETGGYDQDTLIMRAVKHMGDMEILSRDAEGRVLPGKNWESEGE